MKQLEYHQRHLTVLKSQLDKTESMVEADERDETDELADMDRELVNLDVHVVLDGRKSCIGKT